jgi:hypothetical protein
MDDGRLQVFEIRSHAAAGHLKNAERLTAREHVVHFFVVERNFFEIHIDAEAYFYARTASASTERLVSPRKSNLRRPTPPYSSAIEYMSYCVIVLPPFGIELNGRVIGHRRRRDHDARGMHADVPRIALDLLREIENLARIGVALIRLPQFRHFLQAMAL